MATTSPEGSRFVVGRVELRAPATGRLLSIGFEGSAVIWRSAQWWNAYPPGCGQLADKLRDAPKQKGVGLYAGRVALDLIYAPPTTSISELPGIHDSAKHERGAVLYFVSAQNPL